MSYRYSNAKIAGFIKQVRAKEIELSFARSSGPGGQKVNKVETKVQLHRAVTSSEIIPQPYLTKLIKKNEQLINQEGVLRIDTSVHRTQKANKEQTLKKLAKVIKSAFKQETVRKKTEIPKRAHDRRIAAKKRNSKTRSGRKKIVG